MTGIEERIVKLIRLASGEGTPLHEAAVAMAMAERIAAKYGIADWQQLRAAEEEADQESLIWHDLALPSKAHWAFWLALSIFRANGCTPVAIIQGADYWMGQFYDWPEHGRINPPGTHLALAFLGFPSDIHTAQLVYHMVVDLIKENARKEYRRRKQVGLPVRSREVEYRTYALPLIDRINKEAHSSHTSVGQAVPATPSGIAMLRLIPSQTAEAMKRNRFPRLSRATRTGYMTGFSDGSSFARGFSLQRMIGEAKGTPLLTSGG